MVTAEVFWSRELFESRKLYLRGILEISDDLVVRLDKKFHGHC